MINFGHIKIYDSKKGRGTICPESGEDALPFRKSDMQQQAQAQDPEPDQRFSYDVENGENGKRFAINLQPQQGDEEIKQAQARAQQG